MKKTNIALIASGACILLGVVVGGIGVLTGGWNRSVYVNQEGVHLVEKGENMTEKKTLQEFQNIELSVPGVSVSFQEGEEFGVEYTLMPQVEIKRLEVVNQTLYIECEQESISLFSFGLWQDNTITVFYPKGADFELVQAKTGSGSIHVNQMNAKIANLTASSGSLSVDGLKGEGITLEASSGSVKINGIETAFLVAGSTSGNVSVENCTAFNNIVCSSNSGSVKLNALKASGGIGVNASSGSIKAENIQTEDQVALNTKSGSVSAKDISAGAFRASAASGSVKVEGCSVDSFQGKCASGSLRGTGIKSRQTSVESIAGSIRLEGDLTGETVANTSAGSIEIKTTAPKEKSAYLLSSTAGTAKVDGVKESGSLNQKAENTFRLSATAGSVSLNFVS